MTEIVNFPFAALVGQEELSIASHRAEFVLCEAARAHAAADARTEAAVDDVAAVARLALRLRRSEFMRRFLEESQAEVGEIDATLQSARNER